MTDTAQNEDTALPDGFEPLFDRLRSQSEEERKSIRAEAEEAVEAIRNETKSEKLKAMEEGQRELDGLAESIRRKAVAQANRTRRDTVRREIGLAIDRVLAKCKVNARHYLDDPTFVTRLDKLLKEAMCCARTYRDRVGGGDVTVVVHPKLGDAVRNCLKGDPQKATVVESETAETGVLVLLDGTPYRIVNTVESRLLKNDETIRSRLSKRLTDAMEAKHAE